MAKTQVVCLSDVDIKELRVSVPGWKGSHLTVEERKEMVKLHATKDAGFYDKLRSFAQIAFNLDST